MTTFDPLTALALPSGALVDRRVPKKLLIENGTFAAGDQRHIREGVEKSRWVAALKPSTAGIAEYRDAEREYIEIAVLTLRLGPDAKSERLVELVHRAIPYPVLLIAWRQEVPEISLAHKRRSLGGADKTVIDGDIVGARLGDDCPAEPLAAFRRALALERQPHGTLRDLYQGWINTIHTLRATMITGEFRLPTTAAAASAREATLREYRRLSERIKTIRSGAGKTKQMARRAELDAARGRL